MRTVLVAIVLVGSAWTCGGQKEWVIPRSGEGACMCAAVCSCTGSTDEESQKERKRCFDACDCDVCAGEAPPE